MVLCPPLLVPGDARCRPWELNRGVTVELQEYADQFLTAHPLDLLELRFPWMFSRRLSFPGPHP